MKATITVFLCLSAILVAQDVATVPPSRDAIRISSTDIPPRTMVKPAYPEEARKKGVQGDVVLDVVIGKDGKVESVRTIRGVANLATAASDAVKQWTWEPFLKNEKPLRVLVTVTIQFRLQQKSERKKQ